MARKSNKTAHVLNLLAAGHDAKKDDGNESVEETAEVKTAASASDAETPAAAETPAPETPAPEAPAPEASAPAAAPSVSVVDTAGDDPVADLIHQKLLEELNIPEPEIAPEADIEPEELNIPEPEIAPEADIEPEELNIPDPDVKEEPDFEPVIELKPKAAAEPEAETQKAQQEAKPEQQESQTETEPEQQEVQTETEPEKQEAEPEPDFVAVNVMEQIVRDKVIYFMRQFEVCTCDRCIADTVALALNGLPPKYVITSPGAAAPLVSYYTNRFISMITVEVTKACMIVKEHPRH